MIKYQSFLEFLCKNPPNSLDDLILVLQTLHMNFFFVFFILNGPVGETREKVQKFTESQEES